MLEDTPFRMRCCWSRPARYQNGFVAGCVVVNADHGRPWSQTWAEFLNRHGNTDVIHTRQRRSSIRIVRPYRILFKLEERLYVGWTRNFCLKGASLPYPERCQKRASATCRSASTRSGSASTKRT